MMTHHRRVKAQLRSFAVARHLVERGHQVSLIVTSDDRRGRVVRGEQHGVQVVESPDLLWGKLRSGWDLWNLANRIGYLARDPYSYDLVHCFETRPATIYPALLYARRYRVPLITDWNDWWGRGGIIDELRPRWYRMLFGRVETYYEEAFRTTGDGLTAISTALARRAERLGVPREQILHLPGGIPPEMLQPRELDECRRQVGWTQQGPVIGFSSLDSHLDMELVMRALAIVAARYPTVKLLVTGKSGEAVRRLAMENGVESNLYLTGFLPADQLPLYLGCSDLFVLPFPEKVYNIGRWPNKIGDYMSTGRPTVANPTGDIRTLFESQRVGLLAGWDAQEFAGQILRLIQDPGLARELGANARRVAETQYDWRILVARLEQFYMRVLSTWA
ncbi:MAG TPA: glycosyltransferase family 4 protein [Chloroflexota bacterium]|nr:glycosyltransferase family 4 protein [Chloroflexota bacterium]